MSALLKKHNFDIVFDSQKMYRLLLEAISNPTREVRIGECADKLYGETPGMLALAMTLLDNEVTFCAFGNSTLREEIHSLTMSKSEEAESADFIFAADPNDIESAIRLAKCGTLRDPHKSATVIINDGGDKLHKLSLRGPGIKGAAEITVSEAMFNAIRIRDDRQYEYPQGIELIFVSDDGGLLTVPRMTHREAN